jgi:hypothetical protein
MQWLKVKDRPYKQLYCPECGAYTLEDEDWDSLHFLSVDYDEFTSHINSTFTLNCATCGALWIPPWSRRYYPPFDFLRNNYIEMEYYGTRDIAYAQANLRFLGRWSIRAGVRDTLILNHEQKTVCDQYEHAVREGEIDDAIRILQTPITIPDRKLGAWLLVANFFDMHQLAQVLQSRLTHTPPNEK